MNSLYTRSRWPRLLFIVGLAAACSSGEQRRAAPSTPAVPVATDAHSNLGLLCDSVRTDTTLANQGNVNLDEGPSEGSNLVLFGGDTVRERIEEEVLGGISEWRATYVFANRQPVCVVGTQREYNDADDTALWRRDLRITWYGAPGDSLVETDSGKVNAATEEDRRALIANMRNKIDSLRTAVSHKIRSGSPANINQ